MHLCRMSVNLIRFPHQTSVAVIQDSSWTPGHFKYISITTPIASALKNYYIQSFLELEVPTDILNHFWIQVVVSFLKPSETAARRFQKRNGRCRYETVSEARIRSGTVINL